MDCLQLPCIRVEEAVSWTQRFLTRNFWLKNRILFMTNKFKICMISETSSMVCGVTASCNITQECPFSFPGQDNQTSSTILLENRCFIIPLHSNCMLNNIRVVFLLWNLVKQCKIGSKKLHNSSHSPILSHNLPWKYRTISEFLLHPNRWPDCMHLLKTSWKSVVLTNKVGRILDILWGFLIKQLFHSHLLDMRWLWPTHIQHALME